MKVVKHGKKGAMIFTPENEHEVETLKKAEDEAWTAAAESIEVEKEKEWKFRCLQVTPDLQRAKEYYAWLTTRG